MLAATRSERQIIYWRPASTFELHLLDVGVCITKRGSIEPYTAFPGAL